MAKEFHFGNQKDIKLDNTFNMKHRYIIIALLAVATHLVAVGHYIYPFNNIWHENDIWYLVVSNDFNDIDPAHDDIPTLNNLFLYGFTVNPDNRETFITPDGKIVPKFYRGMRIVQPHSKNDRHLSDRDDPKDGSYIGNIYIPDSLYYNWDEFYYILDSAKHALDSVRSLRTPIYMPLGYQRLCLKDLPKMQKIQVGTCFIVAPGALQNCAKLDTVIFEKGPYIFGKAVMNCPSIKTIVIQSQLPVLENETAFEHSIYNNATLYLPDELMEERKKDPIWSKFLHVKSLSEFTQPDWGYVPDYWPSNR
ncbi:MAG: hypothetical protein NC217_07315 [Muribaculaceae bacterium]|nr:hypothetical protein [Muribaculaceae bacterium]